MQRMAGHLLDRRGGVRLEHCAQSWRRPVYLAVSHAVPRRALYVPQQPSVAPWRRHRGSVRDGDQRHTHSLSSQRGGDGCCTVLHVSLRLGPQLQTAGGRRH
eukprot:3941243-Rhodomonas_salina.1